MPPVPYLSGPGGFLCGTFQTACAEIRLRADRKLGEMLSDMPMRGGDHGNQHTGGKVASCNLANLGITKTQSSRWQAACWTRRIAFLTRCGSTMSGESLEMQNQCAEIKLRADRKLGEMLGEMPKHPGGRPSENLSHDVTSLSDLGITKTQSSRWQAVASLLRSFVLGGC